MKKHAGIIIIIFIVFIGGVGVILSQGTPPQETQPSLDIIEEKLLNASSLHFDSMSREEVMQTFGIELYDVEKGLFLIERNEEESLEDATLFIALQDYQDNHRDAIEAFFLANEENMKIKKIEKENLLIFIYDPNNEDILEYLDI